MLGLIFGRNAGLTRTLEPALILPRLLFFLGLPSLPKKGVLALCGEVTADISGLEVADPGRFIVDEAVLKGPSLGVFRAWMRGVLSADALPARGRRPGVADGGSAKSSSPGSMRDIALG